MADAVVIYSKKGGGAAIPLTVRIDWLPDGTIIPLLYWTPDGTCYRVVAHSPGIWLAFLRDRDVGIRFKVRGEIIETPDPEAEEMLHTTDDTYLYLADNRFSQKNIIDNRYAHPSKEYIPVTLDIFPDSDYELIYFTVQEKRYRVEKTRDIDRRGCFRAGGIGVWHKVEARLVEADTDDDPDPQKSERRVAAIYWELDKWFVHVAEKTA